MFKKVILWFLVAIISLPLGLALTVNPAKAAGKIASDSQNPEKIKTTEPKMAFVGEPTGLHRGNTYVAGQSIHCLISLSGKPISVWAEVGVLDANFPQNLTFLSLGQGNWELVTPKLSDNLNIGSHLMKIFAKDALGKIIQIEIKLTLRRFTPVTITSYKVASNGTAEIDWNPVSWADVYLVNWQIQGDNPSKKFETTKLPQISIENLEPGTLYEVRIQPLRGDAVGPAAKAVFKTLGDAPQKEVAGEVVVAQPQEFKKITPSIDEGVATTKEVARLSPKVSEQVTPTPTPSLTPTPSPTPSPSESPKTTPGGWNKVLIALSILIIAAGAAIGGYYGYEWLMLRSKDKEPPASSSRW